MDQEKNQLTTQSESSSANNYLAKLFREYPKIRNLKNMVPIEQAIMRCVVLVGIPTDNYPKGIEKELLIEHICKHYPGHVAPEIIKAFEMAITRSFPNVDYSELLKHYGKFSPEFLSRVMSVYNEHERSKVLALQTNVKPTYKEPEFDLIMHYESWILNGNKTIRNGGNIDNWPAYICVEFYDQLSSWGIMNFDKEERKAHWDMAKVENPIKKRLSAFENAETMKEYNIRLIKISKTSLFKQWMNERAFEECDMRALIWPKLLSYL